MSFSQESNIFPYTSSLLLFWGRILISLPFFAAGFGQIIHYKDSCNIVRLLGFSFAQTICVSGIALNLIGSVLLILGCKSRVGIVFLAAALLPVTFVLHFSADQKINFLRNIAILGGLMSFFALGPGNWSLDCAGGKSDKKLGE